MNNRHLCCICQHHSLGKDVVIHHIDGDPNKNVAGNLAVLCLEHASQADAGLKRGKLGSGKKLKPTEVKEYKRIWERKIELENKYRRPVISSIKRKQLETLFHFEIRKTVNEIISLGDTDKRIEEKFEYLNQFYLEEVFQNINLRKLLLDAYSDMAIQIIERTELPKKICASVESLFFHLVGPDEVGLHPEDKPLLSRALKVLKTLGEFSAEFNKISILERVCKSVYHFGEIATWYELSQEKTKAYRTLTTIKKACLEYEGAKKTTTEIKKEREKRQAIVDKYSKKLKEIK